MSGGIQQEVTFFGPQDVLTEIAAFVRDNYKGNINFSYDKTHLLLREMIHNDIYKPQNEIASICKEFPMVTVIGYHEFTWATSMQAVISPEGSDKLTVISMDYDDEGPRPYAKKIHKLVGPKGLKVLTEICTIIQEEIEEDAADLLKGHDTATKFEPPQKKKKTVSKA